MEKETEEEGGYLVHRRQTFMDQESRSRLIEEPEPGPCFPKFTGWTQLFIPMTGAASPRCQNFPFAQKSPPLPSPVDGRRLIDAGGDDSIFLSSLRQIPAVSDSRDWPLLPGATVVRLVHMLFFSHTFCSYTHFHVGVTSQQFPMPSGPISSSGG